MSPSQENAMTGSCVSNGGEPQGGDVWDMVLTMDQPVLRTWGTIGSLDQPKENPFFTESRTDCVKNVWKVARGHMFMYMNKSLAEHVLLTDLTRKELIRDLKLLLIGVPSETFQYTEV